MTPEERQQLAASKEIEKMMQMGNDEEIAKIKLLLLGAGESGKSTIFKQMRVLYGAQLSDAEVAQFVPVVYSNIILSMKILLNETTSMGYEDDVSDRRYLASMFPSSFAMTANFNANSTRRSIIVLNVIL
jgi:hypothetical protein